MKQFIPKFGEKYYVPSFINNHKCSIFRNIDSEFDQKMIERGLTFENEQLANRFHDVAMNAIMYELAKEQVATYINSIETIGIGVNYATIRYHEGFEAMDYYNIKIEGSLERRVSDMDSRPTVSTFIGCWWIEDESGELVGKINDSIDYELIN
jgi:hypothetical protein